MSLLGPRTVFFELLISTNRPVHHDRVGWIKQITEEDFRHFVKIYSESFLETNLQDYVGGQKVDKIYNNMKNILSNFNLSVSLSIHLIVSFSPCWRSITLRVMPDHCSFLY